MSAFEIKNVQRIGFLLVPNFALMSYASATEPLRAANLLAGKELYEVVPLSVDGKAVRCSSGLSVDCRDISTFDESYHILFVCAGGSAHDWQLGERVYGMLRRLARLGVRIGGISSGAYVLAAARLLDNRDFTIHWEHVDVLREAFSQLSPRQARHVIDGNRITCAGGVAPLDMMHALITERMGAHFARQVSDWYLHTMISEPEAPQRGSSTERFGTHHPALLMVIEKMESTIEKPLDRNSMARLAGVSARHLDRLFAKHLKAGFLDTYRSIRLNHARRLLEQSPLSISEVAFATGFSSAGHFSRCFKLAYGTRPKELRQNISSKSLHFSFKESDMNINRMEE